MNFIPTPVLSQRLWGRDILLLFGIGLILRLAFLALTAANFPTDSYWSAFIDTNYHREVARFLTTGDSGFEESLILVGPGYGAIIWLLAKFIGWSVWAHLILQTVVGALNCALISFLAIQIGAERRIALTAGYLHALSLSAISLSCMAYTETWFVFFTLCSLILWWQVMTSGRWWPTLFCILAITSAGLVRSVGQFYLVIFALLGALTLGSEARRQGFAAIQTRLGWLTALFLISAGLLGSWGWRNYETHGVFTISETGTRAGRLYWIAATSAGGKDKSLIEKSRSQWDTELKTRFPDEAPTIKERHDFDVAIIRDSVESRPLAFATQYLKNVWSNATTESYIQQIQVPQLNPLWRWWSRVFGAVGGPLLFALALVGMFSVYRHNATATIFLGVFYFYFALITGASFWQGSRLFFPSQTVATILQASAIVSLASFLLKNSPFRTRSWRSKM